MVLRAPLLPLDTLSSWSAGVAAPDALGAADADLERALAADRALLRGRLAAVVADEQVADGLDLTSPELARGVARWRAEPDTKRGLSAERSLVRYVTRAASRPDLFGLAGAYTVGRFGADASLELAAREQLEVRARLDSGLLRDVVRRAASEAVADPAFVVRRNPGVYLAGGRLRVAVRTSATMHRLAAIRPTPAIELALEAAADGASIGTLGARLEAAGTPPDHARTLLGRLISSGLLLGVAEISATGPDPMRQATALLRSLPGGDVYEAAIGRAAAAIAGSRRTDRRVIDAVANAIESTGVQANRRRCVQVDARRPGTLRLPQRVLAEMRRSIDLLTRVAPPEGESFAAFKEAFERRFAGRRVPLLEALDPDFGLGAIADEGRPGEPAGEAHADARRRVLLHLVERGRCGTVELDERDVAALSPERALPLPASFGVLTSLVARDSRAVAAGDFQLVEPLLHGPSGVALLGRLCVGDAEVEEHVCEHLARQAALHPEVVYAELSAVAETDVGLNITQRPVLREWEIEYGGPSGAPVDRRLQPPDLTVCVEDGEVRLYSSSLGRRVIPSATTAMNPHWLSLPAARFLVALAQEHGAGSLSWYWGDLAEAPVLPRVTHGRTILALRRWNVLPAELEDVRAGTDAAGFRRLQAWRAARGVPRVVSFDHPKSRVLVDFDNVLSVDAFLAATNGLDLVSLVEAPAAGESPLRGPDGRYAHELIVPLLAQPDRVAPVRARPAPAPVRESRRRFAPGGEWLYANLYGPGATADRVLVDHIGPLVTRLRQAALVDRWFFIRYADPGRHLRVRFHGRPAELLGEVLPALNEAVAPALDEGLLYRISIDTYEREVERYGGIEGVELMEHASEADSDAVIELLRRPLGAVERRHLAVASLAGLYADSGLSLEDRRDCCARLRSVWAGTSGASLGAMLGPAERAERAAVAAAVAALDEDGAEPRVAPLRARSLVLAPVLGRLRALEEEGILERSLDDVVCSLAHMAVNRLLKRGANRDEVRVHDALARLYEGRLARERAGARAAPARA